MPSLYGWQYEKNNYMDINNPFFDDMRDIPIAINSHGEQVQVVGEKQKLAKSIWIILLVVLSIVILIRVIVK